MSWPQNASAPSSPIAPSSEGSSSALAHAVLCRLLATSSTPPLQVQWRHCSSPRCWNVPLQLGCGYACVRHRPCTNPICSCEGWRRDSWPIAPPKVGMGPAGASRIRLCSGVLHQCNSVSRASRQHSEAVGVRRSHCRRATTPPNVMHVHMPLTGSKAAVS